ncbi:MAG TPA: S1 RNA-binding domain-containing protein, partial [Phycisphaerae bacterium]|nr:S1 RNA-binding domain-containing protein [Phycisphaerae bacterium]
MDADFEQKSDTNTGDNLYLDDSLEQEIADALGGMSVEEILESEEKTAYGHSETGVRKGRVISIQGDDIFVFFGGRTQGVLPASQFADEPLPAEGDVVEVTIEGFEGSEGLLLLSRKGAVLAATWDSLEKGAIVEGRVTGLNKGGLELKVGGVRAFMPISQVDLNRIEDLTPYLNRKLICEVTELDRSDNNVVVSAKKVLAREAAHLKEQTLQAIQVDDIVSGTVRSIMPYGAFVDIGGIDGLLHVSDMSHSRVEDPASIVQPGQQVEVKILKINTDTGKISLGLKQTLTDPWEVAEVTWPAGDVVTGKVTKLMDFGAFVELAEGVEGLVPMGELTFERRVKSASDVLSEGETIRVKVL